ncbi:MAG: twin-arginine translocase TatA/TatE family subunit [Desulfamplus sp.]|nr:twin-arginine translocase TatA/TatE family subunit [Desulfamplus sp.]
MFGLGMPEILLILAIALIVIGPKKLPDMAKSLGRALGEFKNAAQDFKRSIDLESSAREFTEPVKNIRDDIKKTMNPLESGLEKNNSNKEDYSKDTSNKEDSSTGDEISDILPQESNEGKNKAGKHLENDLKNSKSHGDAVK